VRQEVGAVPNAPIEQDQRLCERGGIHMKSRFGDGLGCQQKPDYRQHG